LRICRNWSRHCRSCNIIFKSWSTCVWTCILNFELEPKSQELGPMFPDLEPMFQELEPKFQELKPTCQELEPKFQDGRHMF
jgi:hypothetical protein